MSIGLPVRNGERFVEAALDSLSTQTFADFELIISDNGSTDRTPEICRSYSARDPRVRYYFNEANRGAAWNFNRVFRLSSGRYFKWAAHDDVCAPSFLARCVEVLDSDPSIVLCYTREVDIDDQGRLLGVRPYLMDGASATPHERLANLLRRNRGSPPIFGLLRAETLRQTRLIGGYDASDQVLLAELVLRGRFHEVPETLLLHREHAQRSVYAHRNRYSATGWFDPARVGHVMLPTWRIFREYVRAIARSPLGRSERTWSYLVLTRWLRMRRREMVRELAVAGRSVLLRTQPWAARS